LATEKSVGRKILFKHREWEVRAVSEDAFDGVQIALFSAGSEASRIWAPIAASRGAVVVDNSSAWRMETDVPLVVPEVNAEDIGGHRGIIANPPTARPSRLSWPCIRSTGRGPWKVSAPLRSSRCPVPVRPLSRS